MNLQSAEAETLFDATIDVLKKELLDGNILTFQNFGQFETKKKNERISVNPLTQERMLVPPKLSISFKPSNILKERFNKED